MISKHPYRAERRACWSTCVAVAVLVGIYMVAGILLADAARATGNERSDKCLTDSSHDGKHPLHHYGWGHCRTTQPTTGGPGPTPTPSPTKTPKPTHTGTHTSKPSTTSSTTSATASATSLTTTGSSIGSPPSTISATSDTRAVLPNTGWPLGAWGVAFFVLVAFGAACFVSAWAARRGGRA